MKTSEVYLYNQTIVANRDLYPNMIRQNGWQSFCCTVKEHFYINL